MANKCLVAGKPRLRLLLKYPGAGPLTTWCFRAFFRGEQGPEHVSDLIETCVACLQRASWSFPSTIPWRGLHA